MKNHYIPQFLIKRFSKSINVFNLETGEYRKDRPSQKVFYEKNIYDDDIEEMLNIKFERRFSNLLKDKLLNKDKEITLTRFESYFLRKFMLLMSVRTLIGNGLHFFLSGIQETSKEYLRLSKPFGDTFRAEALPSISECGWDDRTILNNFLRALCETDSLEQLVQHENVVKEMYVFAIPFIRGFISFWDADDNTDFILSDNAITYENECASQLTNLVAESKMSYLNYCIVHDPKPLNLAHCDLFRTVRAFPENAMIFNLSNKRCMLLINPFFCPYFQRGYKVSIVGKDGSRDDYIAKKPDIWPAFFQDKELYEPCQKITLIDELIFSPFDKFIYSVKKLNLEDTIFANHMLCSQSHILIGFDDLNRVIDSILFTAVFAIKNLATKDAIDHKDSNYELYELNRLKNSNFVHLIFDQVKDYGGYDFNAPDSDSLLNEYLRRTFNDFDNNFYIFNHLYNNLDSIKDNHSFDWLNRNDGESKVAYITRKRKELAQRFNKNID